jgi:hypothetical protein
MPIRESIERQPDCLVEGFISKKGKTMFTHDFKWHSICIPIGFLAALCLLSTASHGQDEGEDGAPLQPPSTIQTDTNAPPVAQTLVPEGIFAMQLAEALKLGPVPDEAKAEELLAAWELNPKMGGLRNIRLPQPY